ncbi:MAG: GerAB/ArcD/ProY family transporter [Chloroflexota bacterium]
MKRPIERISTAQLRMLAGGVFTGTVFLPISSALARQAGSDSTVALIVSMLLAAILAYFVIHPAILRFPRLGLAEQFRLAFGGLLGRVLAAVIAISLYGFSACLARQIADVYIVSLMPRTPIWVFAGPVLFLAAMMAREGVEVLVRYTAVVFPIILLTLLAIIGLTMTSISLANFLPLFENGLVGPAQAVATGFMYAGEMVVVIWALVPAINQPRGANFAILSGAALAAVALVGINFVTIGIFSAPEVARLFYATIDLSKTIQSGGYVRGVESIVIGIFSAASVLKVSAFLLAGSVILADVFGLQDYRALTLPAAALALVGVVRLHDPATMQRLLDGIDRVIMLPAFIVLPPLVRVLAVWRSRKRGTSVA